MGSKLAVLAAVIATAQTAGADPAADLKRGIELYKAGKYGDAAALLKQAYEATGKPETLFSLAQAERLAGDCTSAAAHYHKVVELVSDLNVAKLVEQNLALCEPPKPAEPAPKSEPAPPPPPPEVITKTVVREVGHTDVLAALALTAGALGTGAAGGLYLAMQANRDAAGRARTLDDHVELEHRADSDRIAMVAAGAVGLAFIGLAVYRWTRSDDAPRAEVAIAPSASGAAVWVTSRW